MDNIVITGGSGLVGNGVKSALKNSIYCDEYNFIFMSSKDCDLSNYQEAYAYFSLYKPKYVIHLAALVAVLITGFPAETMVIDLWVTMQESLRGYGFSLVWVWIIWIAIVIALYPLCSWYNTYKSNHRDKWWLSYF